MKHKSRITRFVLLALIVVGILIIPIAPIARLANEGDGGTPPGPMQISNYWQQVSYVLMPLGAGISLISGAMLVFIDRGKP